MFLSKSRHLFYLVVVITAILFQVPLINAQNNGVTLLMGIPSAFQGNVNLDSLEAFEDTHPGINIDIVTVEMPESSLVADNIEQHLTSMADYVQMADIVWVSPTFVSSPATAARYYLNLAPLLDSDAEMDQSDFYSAVWQNYQWNNGIWALPVTTTILVPAYDLDAFSRAELPYPNGMWEVTELGRVIEALAIRDGSGNVITPALQTRSDLDEAMLVRVLSGVSWIDTTTIPNSPIFENPELATFIEMWSRLRQSGAIARQGTLTDAPILLLTADEIIRDYPNEHLFLDYDNALLQTQGFAISAGTAYPEQAYALLRYLTTQSDILNTLGGIPARMDAAWLDTISTTQAVPTDLRPQIEHALNVGIPVDSELLYSDYLMQVFGLAPSVPENLIVTLSDLTRQAILDENIAISSTRAIVVQAALNVPLPESGITLRFAVDTLQQLTNRNLWDQVIDDFTRIDPQIAQIELMTSATGLPQNDAANYDCFYYSFPSAMILGSPYILPIDPLLNADSTINHADFLDNTLNSLTFDNHIWGLPLMLTPQVLRYDAEVFSNANLELDQDFWTINQFVDMLRVLRSDNIPVLHPLMGDGNYLLILIAAAGGLPIDYRTTPPTLNFSDPNTIEAMRSILDLARDGYIQYYELGAIGESGDFIYGGSSLPDGVIYVDSLNPLMMGGNLSSYRVIAYPQGQQYNGISYRVGSAYISSETQFPDACYRWISTLARHPELFSGMPALRSIINDPVLIVSQGQDMVNYYLSILEILDSPNTIVFPDIFSRNPVDFFMTHWLYEAFDRYVLRDEDLTIAITDAERYSQELLDCVDNISSAVTSTNYRQEIAICAASVDPRLQ